MTGTRFSHDSPEGREKALPIPRRFSHGPPPSRPARGARAVLLSLVPVLLCPAIPARAQDANRVTPLGGRRGTTVTLTFPGMKDVPTGALLVDGPGLKAAGPFQKGAGQVEIAPDAEPGARQIRLVGPKSVTQPRPFAIGTLREVAEKEPNDSAAQAQALPAPPVVLNGAIPKGQDTDLYRVTLKQGECLVMSAEHRRLAANTYLALYVRDSSGRSLPTTYDIRRMDPTFTFTAPAEGEYLLQLSDITGNMGNVDEGSYYRVTLTTGPWLDYATPPAVPRGQTTPVTLHGWNLGGKAGPGTAAVQVTAPADRESMLVSGGGAPNSLRLAVTAERPSSEVEPNGPAAPQAVTLPALVQGGFGERGDVDAFRFSARARDRITLDVTAREWDSWADPTLEVRDASGKVLASVDDADRSRDPRLVWTAPADGTYTVVVRDLAGGSRGGPASFYQLRIAPSQPELRLTAAEPHVVVKPGAKAELSLTLFQSYQPSEVTLAVEGLPKGVSVEPVKVAAMPTRERSSQVKLSFAAAKDAPPGGAPIRIVARAGAIERAAGWQRTGDGGAPLGSGVTEQLVVLVSTP